MSLSDSLDDLMQRANSAFAANRLDESRQLCEQILQEAPDVLPALILAGASAYRASEPDQAIAHFQRAIEGDPRCAPAFLWLSMALQKSGKKEEALAAAKSATALTPGDPMVQHQLGQCLLELGNAEDAIMPLEKAAAMAANAAQPHLTFGLALKELKMLDHAIRELRRAARLDPSLVDAHIALRHILMDQMDTAGATEEARAIVGLQPDSAQANLWMAQSLLEENKGQEAEPYVTRAIELDAATAEAQSVLGSILQFNGQIREASDRFRQSIELNPIQGSAYLSLVSNAKVSPSDRSMVDKMRSLLDEPTLDDFAKSELTYALGKAHDDLGDYASAMRLYDQANRLAYRIKFGDRPFDRKMAEASLRMTMERMDGDFLSHSGSVGSTDTTPIFVVGMVRSGTTLAEQILSAHSKVGAAGEQSFWIENATSLTGRNKSIDRDLLAKLTDRYVSLLRSIAPGKDRIVDKMPMNYTVLGLLKVAYPRAKFIHIRRQPIDTCLSIYVTPNRSRLPWAHDKANIAFNYVQYQKVMDHWRTVFPAGDLLEIRYEELVADSEQTARAMIDFCGLEWDEACLHPENNKRTVLTPSVWQVRQPIYTTSVARWKHYQGLLGPIETLK